MKELERQYGNLLLGRIEEECRQGYSLGLCDCLFEEHWDDWIDFEGVTMNHQIVHPLNPENPEEEIISYEEDENEDEDERENRWKKSFKQLCQGERGCKAKIKPTLHWTFCLCFSEEYGPLILWNLFQDNGKYVPDEWTKNYDEFEGPVRHMEIGQYIVTD
eukprot:TRINITY_DN1480_c0_g1_i6.p1 TRINITY_DN1480_c0_g1~~TRINITY_DN1480_c0_g1_i6.p1  ORF type:complete len:179 (-),score=31.70 TRINITY_DN1480_c0_g1_i6:51-533(-)